MDIDGIRELSTFDAWASARLFGAAAALTGDERARRVASSFASLDDTLAHILAEDWVWLRRCRGEDPRQTPPSLSLGEVLAERLELLRGLTDDDLAREVAFHSLEGAPLRHTVNDMLVHVVNHSTYHRGQASTILRQLGRSAPETDFVVFREAVLEAAAQPPVLILPGLHDSGPRHWQSQWEALHLGFRRVVQRDWIAPRCRDWVETLDRAVDEAGPEPVLVAHSAGCALVAHWAARGARRAKAALLVAPSDPAAPSFPSEPSGFTPMPMARLPFPSIVVGSRDDPYVPLSRGREYADAWGSRFVDAGEAGHLNGDSCLGDWPFGFALLSELRAL